MLMPVDTTMFRRKSLVGFDAGLILAPDSTKLMLFPTWNRKEDEWWGVYGQLTWKATERLELTVAARHDDQTYRNTSYTDSSLGTVQQVRAKAKTLVVLHRYNKVHRIPESKVCFHVNDDVM